MSKNETPLSASVNLIGAGTSIQGDIKSDGDIRIDGTLKGSLSTKGKLVVGSSGTIEGEVHCQNADVSGTIKAKITVSDLLSLKSTAKLTGDIVSGKLHIEPGANFSGSCCMGAVIKDISFNSGNQQKQSEKAAANY